MKNKAVVFTDQGAVVLTNPDPKDLEGKSFVMNPSLEPVKGVSPHHWKKVGDQVFPMSDEERAALDWQCIPNPILNLFKKEAVKLPESIKVETLVDVPESDQVDILSIVYDEMEKFKNSLIPPWQWMVLGSVISFVSVFIVKGLGG